MNVKRWLGKDRTGLEDVGEILDWGFKHAGQVMDVLR